MAIPNTVPIIGLSWDDILFLMFAAAMIGTALLVVTMRDIIRCGLAMMACFGALAGYIVNTFYSSQPLASNQTVLENYIALPATARRPERWRGEAGRI